MMEISDERLQEVLGQWHEAGRERFGHIQGFDYDSPTCRKSFVRKRRYIYLNGGVIGTLLVDKTDGNIYPAKLSSVSGGHGRPQVVPRGPDFEKLVGNIATIDGKELASDRR